MKFWNIKKKLGMLLAVIFATSALIIGCSNNDCGGKQPTGDCANCQNTDNNPNLCDPTMTFNGQPYFSQGLSEGGTHTIFVNPNNNHQIEVEATTAE